MNSGNSNTTGLNNVFLGQGTGQLNTTGNSNSFSGRAAGLNNTTGSNNICLGIDSGTSSSALTLTTQSNKCVLGNNLMDTYWFSGAANNTINSNSTTMALMATPTTLNISASGKATNILGTLAVTGASTFTGTVSGITKSMVGLANVDNTTDVGKPVSNATTRRKYSTCCSHCPRSR